MSRTVPLSHRAPLEDYQQQAQELWGALQSHDQSAEWRVKWEHPGFRGKSVSDVRAATLDVADAQLVVAREHGFEKWADVAEFTEAVRGDGPVAQFEAAVEAVVAGELDAFRSLLAEHPELVRARSTRRHHATLLHYVAANGVENYRQKTPPNAVAIAKLLLDSGAEVDALADMYDQKCTTMSMLVSSCHPDNAGLQVALAELLLDYGAALDGPGSKWQSAVMTALQFGYLRTAEALARRGPPVNDLAAAAGLGRLEDTLRLLPAADSKSRHAALALAAQHGHAEVVRVLLDAGEDPNRFNPEGFHAGATPLHHAALNNHAAVVRLLVERAPAWTSATPLIKAPLSTGPSTPATPPSPTTSANKRGYERLTPDLADGSRFARSPAPAHGVTERLPTNIETFRRANRRGWHSRGQTSAERECGGAREEPL